MDVGPVGRRRARAVAAVVVLAVLVVTATAVLLPRDDDVAEIDAVVVLGGGGGERVAHGVGLADEHDVPVVVFAEGIDRARHAGLRCQVDVLCHWPEPSTTAGEAATTRDVAEVEGFTRMAVVTSRFHANRARTLFRQCLGDRVDVVGAPADGGLSQQAYRHLRELVGHAAAVSVRRAC